MMLCVAVHGRHFIISMDAMCTSIIDGVNARIESANE